MASALMTGTIVAYAALTIGEMRMADTMLNACCPENDSMENEKENE